MQTEIEKKFMALVESLEHLKREKEQMEQARKAASRPCCVNCERYLSSLDGAQCSHRRRPALRSLIETKKETELRERREKVEKGRARKVRRQQSALETVSVVEGCKDDEYDIESALLAIEGPPHQYSKQKLKKICTKPRVKGQLKEIGNITFNGNASSISTYNYPKVQSYESPEGDTGLSPTSGEVDIQRHLTKLLFGGKLFGHQVMTDTYGLEEKYREDEQVGLNDVHQAVSDQNIHPCTDMTDKNNGDAGFNDVHNQVEDNLLSIFVEFSVK